MGNNRRAAGLGLDHAQAKRFGKINQVQQAIGAPQNLIALARLNQANIAVI
jgi:hypothetical protein